MHQLIEHTLRHASPSSASAAGSPGSGRAARGSRWTARLPEPPGATTAVAGTATTACTPGGRRAPTGTSRRRAGMKPPPASTSCPAAPPGRRTAWVAAIPFGLCWRRGFWGRRGLRVLCSGENVRQGAVGRKCLEFEFYSGARRRGRGRPRTAFGAHRTGRNPIRLPFSFLSTLSLWLGEQKATVESNHKFQNQ